MAKNLIEEELISVIMPAYNAEKYIRTAIDSILSQTYSNFEFLICDDASTDGTLQIINEFKDKRIRVIRHTVNCGIVSTLNELIELSSGSLIARMDADDISLPNRLGKQANYLNVNNSLVMVGTQYAQIDNRGKIEKIDPVIMNSDDIELALSVKNCFCHGSIMIDKRRITGNTFHYTDKYTYLEDFTLWTTFRKENLKLSNLPEVLYFWRNHDLSTTTSKKKIHNDNLSSFIKSMESMRIKWNNTDILKFAYHGFFSHPDYFYIEDIKYKSNIKREYQYILFEWIRLTWKYKLVYSISAALLVFLISPINVIKKL